MKKIMLSVISIAIVYFIGSYDWTQDAKSHDENQVLVTRKAEAPAPELPQLRKELPKNPIPSYKLDLKEVYKSTLKPLSAGKEPRLDSVIDSPAWKKNFIDPEIMDYHVEYLPSLNKLKRTTLIKVKNMKYPHIVVNEEFTSDPITEEPVLSYYTEAVANHMILQVFDDSILNELIQKNDNVSFRRLNEKNIIAEFKEFDIDTLSAAMNSFEQIPSVKFAEPDYLVHTSTTPDDSNFSNLWGMHNTGQTGGSSDADIDAPEAWNLQTGSGDVIVAVIDTGVDYDHVDLATNMWKNPGETGVDSNGNNKETNGIDDDGNGYTDDIYGYDFINNDADPDDNDHYHGTHCAGTIGGVGNNGQGVAGVAWNVKMMAIKFLGPSGGYTSDAILSVEYATDMGAHLSSNSWGGGGFSQALKDAIDDAGANGALFVAAAGNSGRDTDSSSHYPSSYTSGNVISVAATDHNDGLASFSNYGATSVDLGAPGVSIYSTAPEDSYRSLSGTSMATPHVSGVIALLLSEFPSESLGEIKNRLLSSGDSISSLSGNTITGKRLNAYKALTFNNDKAILTSPAQAGELEATTVTFAWSAGNNVTSYKLLVGSTQGGNDFYDSGDITSRSATVSELPDDGSSVYVTLVSTIDGNEDSNEYTFRAYRSEAYRPAPSAMTSPDVGSTFTSESVTFEWDEGRMVSRNWIYIGSNLGSFDLYGQEVSGGSLTIDLPVDGRVIYARLWSYIEGQWEYADYQYTAADIEPVKAEILSPSTSTTLNTTEPTFTWSEGVGVSAYFIYVGSYRGGNDIDYQYHSRESQSHTSKIYLDGDKVYVRLWSYVGNSWQYSDYEFNTEYHKPEGNVIPSFGFEDDSTMPSGWTTSNDLSSFEWDSAEKISGSNSIKLIGDGETTVQLANQTTSLRRVRSVYLSGFSKSENISEGTYSLSLLATFTDNTQEWRHLNFNSGTNEWIKREQIFIFSKTLKACQVFCQLQSSTGHAWFDNIQVFTSSSSKGKVRKRLSRRSKPPVTNGGFEKVLTNPTGWNSYITRGNKAIWNSSVSYRDDMSLQLYNRKYKTARWQTGWINLENTARSFELSGVSMASSIRMPRKNRGYSYALKVNIKFSDGTTTSRHLPFTLGNHGWQRVRRTYSFTKDIKSVQAFCEASGISGNVWFDNVSLVPEYNDDSSTSSSTTSLTASSNGDSSAPDASAYEFWTPEISESSNLEKESNINFGVNLLLSTLQDFSVKVLTVDGEFILYYSYGTDLEIKDTDDFDVIYTSNEDFDESLNIIFGDDILNVEVIN